MKFKHRLLIWLVAIFLLPILIFIYDGGYNATAMGWIVGVAVLALGYELRLKYLNRKV